MFLNLVLEMAEVDAAAASWQPIPLISAEQRRAGFMGGEGAQWPRSMAVDSTGKFLIFGIDVGGIYRSQDGGKTWEPSNVGYTPRGATAVAIDPKNSRRAIAIGANSSAHPANGIYLTEDGAASWRLVHPVNQAALEIRDALAYDPASFSAQKGETGTIVWSRIILDKPSWGTAESDPSLVASRDGGRTWQRVPGSENLGGMILRAKPKGGAFYAAGDKGLFLVSFRDFTQIRLAEREITGVDVNPKEPESVWISRRNGLFKSVNGGKSFSPINAGPILRPDGILRHIRVSPADPLRFSVWSEQEPNQWNWPRHVTQDGGRTWHTSVKDATGAFLPDNTRQGYTIWSPVDKNTAWAWGGDWATKSTDGGKTFRYSAEGYNAVLVGGAWHFSLSDPNLMMFGSQDYNGAVTEDAGKTWRYLDIAGLAWGGFCYGGYALNRRVMVAGNASGWGAPRILRVSRDGGKSWVDTGLERKGPDTSYGDPRNPRIVFSSDLRSADEGQTWSRMNGCSGVFTHGPDGALYGVLKGSPDKAVRSRDGGATWQAMAEAPDGIADLAVDAKRGRLLAATGFNVRSIPLSATGGAAWTTLETPVDSTGERRVRSVAVDPVNNDVMYAASAGHVWSTSNGVLRSVDGGRTWKPLTLQTPLRPGQKDGGHEGDWVRVHPQTRDLWVSTSCYGIWRHPAP